jgi:hypothetical protein
MNRTIPLISVLAVVLLVSGCIQTCKDKDGDGYGIGPNCLGPDCNDNNASIYDDQLDCTYYVDGSCINYKACSCMAQPPETCNNGIDDDCDGDIDYADSECGYCWDSDGGINYYEKGSVNSTINGTLVDVCNTGVRLIERYCDGNAAESDFFDCPNGCFDGACLVGNQTNRTSLCVGNATAQTCTIYLADTVSFILSRNDTFSEIHTAGLVGTSSATTAVVSVNEDSYTVMEGTSRTFNGGLGGYTNSIEHYTGDDAVNSMVNIRIYYYVPV